MKLAKESFSRGLRFREHSFWNLGFSHKVIPSSHLLTGTLMNCSTPSGGYTQLTLSSLFGLSEYTPEFLTSACWATEAVLNSHQLKIGQFTDVLLYVSFFFRVLSNVSCCQSSLRASAISPAPAPAKTCLIEEILPLPCMFLKSNLTCRKNPGRLEDAGLYQQELQTPVNSRGTVIHRLLWWGFLTLQGLSAIKPRSVYTPQPHCHGWTVCVAVSHSCWQLSCCQNVN